MKNSINYYKLAWIIAAVAFFLTMTWFGMPSMLDRVAAWRNNGMEAHEARCAVLLSDGIKEIK